MMFIIARKSALCIYFDDCPLRAITRTHTVQYALPSKIDGAAMPNGTHTDSRTVAHQCAKHDGNYFTLQRCMTALSGAGLPLVGGAKNPMGCGARRKQQTAHTGLFTGSESGSANAWRQQKAALCPRMSTVGLFSSISSAYRESLQKLPPQFFRLSGVHERATSMGLVFAAKQQRLLKISTSLSPLQPKITSRCIE